MLGVRTTAALAALAVTGCSLLSDTAPPRRPWKTEPPCSDYYVPPVIDSLVGVTLLSGAVYTFQEARHDEEGGVGVLAALVLFSFGALAGGASVRGWLGVARCRAAQDAYAKELGAPPPPTRPQPPPGEPVPPDPPHVSR